MDQLFVLRAEDAEQEFGGGLVELLVFGPRFEVVLEVHEALCFEL